MRRLTADEQSLLDSLHDMLISRRLSVITPEIITAATNVVRTLTDPRPGLHDLIGPVCTTSDLVAWLGISRQGVNKAVREHRIVAVLGPSHTWYYPVWQLTDDRRIVEHLPQVLGRLVGSMPDVHVAQWFVTANADLDRVTPADALRDGVDVHRIIGAAENFARYAGRRRVDDTPLDVQVQVTHLRPSAG